MTQPEITEADRLAAEAFVANHEWLCKDGDWREMHENDQGTIASAFARHRQQAVAEALAAQKEATPLQLWASEAVRRIEAGEISTAVSPNKSYYLIPSASLQNERDVAAERASRKAIAARDAEAERLREALKPFISEIGRLEAEYGFDRPSHQYQPLMIALGDILRFREAHAALQETK